MDRRPNAPADIPFIPQLVILHRPLVAIRYERGVVNECGLGNIANRKSTAIVELVAEAKDNERRPAVRMTNLCHAIWIQKRAACPVGGGVDSEYALLLLDPAPVHIHSEGADVELPEARPVEVITIEIRADVYVDPDSEARLYDKG